MSHFIHLDAVIEIPDSMSVEDWMVEFLLWLEEQDCLADVFPHEIEEE